MPDFTFVTSRLATGGGINSVEDAQAIITAGITHVIDCRAEQDDSLYFTGTKGVQYVWNPTADDGKPKPVEWFEHSFALALPAFAESTAKIYAHCAAGVNRGPSTAYAILRALGLSPADAERTIRSARPQVGLAYKTDADAAVRAIFNV